MPTKERLAKEREGPSRREAANDPDRGFQYFKDAGAGEYRAMMGEVLDTLRRSGMEVNDGLARLAVGQVYIAGKIKMWAVKR